MSELIEGEEITVGNIFLRGTKILKKWIVGKNGTLIPSDGDKTNFDWPKHSYRSNYGFVYGGEPIDNE